jgi:cyclophilin family peptidyl-prolyl cis-trans isomerase
MRNLLLASVASTALFAVSAAQAEPVVVELKTSEGTIKLELDQEKAPLTVANFVRYAQDGHYDDTIFHRVIAGFMIQGGGMTADLTEKPTRAPIKNESANGLTNDPYTVAMARTPAPDSATSQFFINLANNEFLNRARSRDGAGYAVFGKVVEGKEVVDRIAQVETRPRGRHDDVPVKPIVIQSVRVVE